jgi:hypothetical protein
MDMYRILENFDAVNSKRTLTEGRMSMSAIDELYQEWVNSEDAPFDSDSGDQNAVLEKAMRFLNGRVRPEQIEDIADMLANHWHGGQGVMGEERRSEADWDAASLAAGKRGRDARDNPSRHAARAKAGQAMRGNAKPDFLDLDRDGDKTEPMKGAAKGVAEAGKAPFPGTPEYELRFGKTDAGSAFDKKKISTGTVYSRKHFDEPEAGDDDAPKSAGRPKGTGRKLGAKGPSVASKLLKGKGGLKEHDHEHGMDMHMHNDLDSGEYDQEGEMARQDLHTMVDAARELHAILGSDENLPEWVQSKITKALDYIDTARDYMQSVDAERSDQPMAEIAPVIGAMAGRALAGAAGAGSTGQALSGLAGRAVAGAMNSGDDEVAEGPPPGGFKPGDRVTVDGQKGPNGSTTGVYVTQLLTRNDEQPAYAFRFDGKQYPKNTYDTVAHNQIFPAGVEEAGYSAKSARAGKDIGKPGKNFSKIAKGAAERYGSKAAGERVAGAVLNKLRAKEGVEEESADKKDPPFTPDTKSSFKKSTNPNRTNRDSVKALAQKGLADMTTAELKAELKRRSRVEEESTDTRDQHAEKAGKKVTRDIEHDEGHKGRDDDKAEKAGKKVAKDIEYDDKKDKEEKVDETTVSGSVATSAGGDAPKKGKGGMQFGQGVYEGQVAESFEKKLKNVLNEGMSVNVSTDDTGKKSISVNATDSDADALGDMLKMAGLFSSEGYSSVCQDCGGIHEAGACGADMVEEELANSPDEVYTDADYMTQTLSGGLNGPKTTGQTDGSIINRQDSRQGVMAEAGTVIPLGPDPAEQDRRAAEQGYRDASRGINNNPYFNNTRAGRAYRIGQENYEREFGRGDVKEVAERVKTQAESRLWNLYKKI